NAPRPTSRARHHRSRATRKPPRRMKLFSPTFRALFTIALLPAATAQNVQPDPEPDPVLEAIREFNLRDQDAPNEVTVVLDPPNPDENPTPARPLRVTGEPPHDADLSRATEASNSDPSEPTAADALPAGLGGRVEKLR